jgi:hypothetical protein
LFWTSCIFGCDLPSAETAHLHKTLIIFQVWASPREGDVGLFTIGDHCLVEKFPTVIGIDAQDGKRKQQACLLKSGQYRFLTPVQYGQTFRPPGGYIGEGQGVQVPSLTISATMGYQISFQKTGSVSFHSSKVRMGICCLSSVPARVVERPR